MAAPNSRDQISVATRWDRNRTAFGAGHFAKSLVWSLTDLLLGYHANVVMGLSATATGLLLTCTMLYSGVLDLVVAWALRAAEGRPAWTLKAQLAGGIATAILLVLLFYPLVVAPDATFVYLAIVALLFRTAYAVYDVAQNALTSLLPRDSLDARAYVTMRMTLGAAARLCIAASAALLVGDAAGVVSHSALVTLPVAALVLASAFRLSRVSPPRTLPIGGVCPTVAAGMMRPLLAATAHAAGLTLLSRFLLFVDSGIAGRSTGSVLLVSFVTGTVIGPFVTVRLTTSIGGERCSIVLVGAMLLGALSLVIAPHDLPSVPAALLYGIGLGGSGAMIWAATSDAIRTQADRGGTRTDLLTFAALTATIKLSVAATGVVFGVLLDGFKAGDNRAATAIVTISLLGGWSFVCAIRPAKAEDYLINNEIKHARTGARG